MAYSCGRRLLGAALFIALAVPIAATEDPTPAPLRMSMSDAVNRALSSSYALVAVDKRISDAASYLDRSRAWLASNPFFTGGAAASSDRFTDSSQGEVNSGKKGFGPSYTFTLQQDFEIAGQRGKRIQAATSGLEVARNERLSTEATVAAEAKKLFAAALESAAKLALTEQSTKLLESVNAAFERNPTRDSEKIALNTSTIQVQRQRRREGAARRAREDAYRQLKRAIGLPLDVQITLEGTLEQRPRDLPSYRTLLDGLADRRADVAAYRALLSRADAELALAQRLAIPDVSLFAFISRFDSGDSDIQTSGGGSLGFSLPIFQNNGTSVDDAIRERQRAAAELDDLIALVESNLASAYGLTQDAAADLRSVLAEILPLARENVELQERRARRGEVPAYDVVDYQLDLVSAEEDLVAAQRAYTDALIELEKAAAVPLLVGPADDVSAQAAGATETEEKSDAQKQQAR